MAYMIPLQQQRHCPGLRNKQLVPSLPLIVRRSSCHWTVEIVTFSCILMTLGGTILIWTAIQPMYGSFIVGIVLIALGACWIGIMCALKANRDEMKEGTDSEPTSDHNHDEAASMTSALNDVRSGYQASLMQPLTYRDNVVPNYTSTASSTFRQNHVINEVRESPDGAEDAPDVGGCV